MWVLHAAHCLVVVVMVEPDSRSFVRQLRIHEEARGRLLKICSFFCLACITPSFNRTIEDNDIVETADLGTFVLFSAKMLFLLSS